MTVHRKGVRSAGAAAVTVGIVMLSIAMPPGLEGQTLPRASATVNACDTLDRDYSTESTAIFDLNDLVPSVIRDQILLKRYLRDTRFMEIRRLCSDTAAVDAIFLRALEIADGDTRYALFIALLASMDHFKVGVKMPLLGVLWIPLTTETDSVFSVRHSHLPRTVLPDSAGRTAHDSDKLQHFFGSAYVAYLTNSRSIANFFGNMIEEGEDAFIVGGVNDERDKYANRLGQEFGLRLLDEVDVLPSDVLWKKSR